MSALAGLAFAIAALVAADILQIEVGANDIGGVVGHLSLFFGVFLAGLLTWWAVMARPGRLSVWRAAAAGVIVAVLSYPLVFAIAEFLPLHADNAGFLQRLRGVMLAAGLSLVITGFAMTVIMALVGATLAYAFNKARPGEEWVDAQGQRWPVIGKGAQLAGVVAAVLVAFLIGVFATLSLLPFDARTLVPSAWSGKPAQDYDEAMAAFDAIRQSEAGMALHERCPSRLLTHGHKVERVVIYFHGLTSCPAQGDALAQDLFNQGYNVYLPRMKGHGEADPDTLSLMDLEAEDLFSLGNESVDLARGLGEKVTVTGLSAGGTIAMWIAQYRGDVDAVLAISPFLGPHVIPPWATNVANRVALMLPDLLLWWNPTETVGDSDQSYAFPRPSVHTLAQVMRLGRVVEAGSRHEPPAVPSIGVLLNSADIAVSNALTLQVVANWRAHGSEVRVETLDFFRLLPHDLINPSEPQADTALVYAKILEMIGSEP